MRKTTRLKELLYADKIVLTPGVHDCMSAIIAERVGFDVAYMTGFGASASLIGKPDGGILTRAEMAERARNLAMAVDIPVVGDGDDGFGNAIGMMRTIELYEAAGCAGIQLEDQVAPKRCGHMAGKRVVTFEEYLGKIEAAVAARKDPDFVIIARTDARAVNGIEDAIERMKACEKAGADAVFVEAVESVEEMKLVNSELKIPSIANMVEGGKTPSLTAQELEDLGYALAVCPTAGTFAMAKAVMDVFEELKRTGTTAGVKDRMIQFCDFNSLIGLDKYSELEARFVR